MKTNNGLTLIEILIGMLVMTSIILAGSSIYLSGMNLSVDAQYSAQAHRNAQIVMMHIEKNAREAGSVFTVSTSPMSVTFNAYRSSIQSRYSFSGNTITYIPNTVIPAVNTVFNHIQSCSFAPHIDTGGVVLDVTITALDNNDTSSGNTCRLETSIEAAYSAAS